MLNCKVELSPVITDNSRLVLPAESQQCDCGPENVSPSPASLSSPLLSPPDNPLINR